MACASPFKHDKIKIIKELGILRCRRGWGAAQLLGSSAIATPQWDHAGVRHQSYPRLSQVPPDPLDCRALRERQLSVRQPIWSNFRIRSYWTRIVLSKII